ncbi:apolipoprotein L3-like isoform X1 [Myotis yumanensis]|uniref:apolipoprotein L3-like isoform X1 n=2 Tax=Myotis yumanensis TaxID=159337 RepID=UPI0038D01D0D
MTSEADRICPEDEEFVVAIEYLNDPFNKEKLQHFLSDESWERFVAAAKLPRDEADALYADLRQQETLMAEEDKDMPSIEQEFRESFMKQFPQEKQFIEECIGKLYALADEVDKVHRDCTISKVAASSTSIVSGILTIIGLSLAPVTLGASLVLLATGMGLGAAAAVTDMTADIVEDSKNTSAKAKARCLVSKGSDKVNVVQELLLGNAPKIVSLAVRCSISVKDIVKNAHAFNLAKSNPVLAAEARSFMRTGTMSAPSDMQVQKAFGGTALTMSKGARIAGATMAGVSLLVDVIKLVIESVHLHKGAKAQSAEELRQLAQELERRWEERIHFLESLPNP